jgi:hypothetical protein
MKRFNIQKFKLKIQEISQAINLTTVKINNSEGKSLKALSIHDALNLPVFLKEYTWITPESLQVWYHSAQFHKKHLDLKRLQRKWEKELESLSINDGHGDMLLNQWRLYVPHPRRLLLLKKLIKLAEHLSQNDDAASEMLFHTLEVEFNCYLSASDFAVLNISGINKSLNPTLLEIFHKFLKADLVRLIRNIYKGIRRDLRQFFRSIIHFLFKNMSDESDADNFLFNTLSNKRLLTVQIHHYDNQRNNRNFKTNTQSSRSFT